MPEARFVPKPTGVCPELTEGIVTFKPAGKTRDVQIWISPEAARSLDGPLVFYWYGTGGAPAQAEAGLGASTIAAIKALGGIVAAPVHDPAAGIWPWYLVAGTQELDLEVADEVLACAIEKVGVDLRRIHSVGFSAGAIHTVQMGYRRAGYLASVVSYSGGQQAPIPDQDQTNKFAAMIFHGGPSDQVVVSFQMVSERYQAEMKMAGRFAFICNHGKGHQIPTDALPSVWRFLQDYPFGVTPSPYASGLPAGFPAYCEPPG
jgi:predicted esterase